MKNRKFEAVTYNQVAKFLGMLLFLLVLITYDKEYAKPIYIFSIAIGIRIVYFVKSKIEVRSSTREETEFNI